MENIKDNIVVFIDKNQKTIYYVLLVFVSGLFVLSGLAKLLSKPAAVEEFTSVGLPIWFMYLIGISEILGAICLWIKKLFEYASEGLFLVLVGAFGATMVSFGFLEALYPLSVFVLLYLLFWLNKKRI
jgi:uncharacterized membrane protein